jgi:hypothetical protein
MVFLDEIKAGYKSAKHVITNEFARGIIASDARFIALVNEVGEETIKENHTKSKEVKNDLFTN